MTDHSYTPNDSVCEATDFESTNPIVVSESNNIAGEQFGKYVLVGEIATGGMAEVFLGVKHGLEGFLKVVVLKRVLPQFSDNEQFVRMFIDEARIAARLDHPNIVRTYEFGEVNGQYFTAMEYLPGEDLRGILRRLSHSRQRLPVHVSVGIVMQLCAGLHCAHQLTDTNGRPLNLVHRDVSPPNIVITYGGEVKIIDFGVAKTNTTETATGTIKGKLAYMPPEQVLGRGVGQRSDIFSAGVVLWELLTGRRLFGRESDAATLYAIMNDPIPPPSRYRSEVPRELDAIVLRALSRVPADRFDTAEEMEAVLEQFLESQPKYDARCLSAIVEELFGSERANAKRAIQQTRSLGHNISLVMKLRSEIRPELANVETLAAGSTSDVAPHGAHPPHPSGRIGPRMIALGAVVLACIAGAGIYRAARSTGNEATTAAPGAVLVESEPSGAAISIGGEPTGLTTPATLTGLAAQRITVRLQLRGHDAVEQTFDVPKTGTLAQRLTLPPAVGRLVLADLPSDASVFVDGTEYLAGDVIDVTGGPHDVRVVVNGKTLVNQQLETSSGDQVWRFTGSRLVTK